MSQNNMIMAFFYVYLLSSILGTSYTMVMIAHDALFNTKYTENMKSVFFIGIPILNTILALKIIFIVFISILFPIKKEIKHE